MARTKKQYFIVDNLDKESGEVIKKSLSALPDVSGIRYDLQKGMIEVEAGKDMEAQVKLACDVSGTTFRIRVKKGQV
jgi:hypothetical protein